jgi:hypothetical protein
MYTVNELLFPHEVIESLGRLRDAEWRSLIEHIVKQDECHEDTLAFMLMMIRLDGCMSCETDSFRAMRGCKLCAHQTLRRYKGSTQELLAMYEAARNDVQIYHQQNADVDILP